MTGAREDSRALLCPFRVLDWEVDTPTTLRHVSGLRLHVARRKRDSLLSTFSEFWSLSNGRGIVALVPRSSDSVVHDLDKGLNPALQEASQEGQIRWKAALIRAGADAGMWLSLSCFKTRAVFFNPANGTVRIPYTQPLRAGAHAIQHALDLSEPESYRSPVLVFDVPGTRHARLAVLAQAAQLRVSRRTASVREARP